MEKIIIYSARESGRKILEDYTCPLDTSSKVLCFSDSNPALWGKTVEGFEIMPPSEIAKMDFDRIVVASVKHYKEIQLFLREDLGIPPAKIDCSDVIYFEKARRLFCAYQAKVFAARGVSDGAVAEAGVYRGEFAKYMNLYFPNRLIYLFDTFDGYAERDLNVDSERNIKTVIPENQNADTSVELVRSVLPYPDKAVFKVGIFPDTAVGTDDTFAFVSLDMNLYAPTLAGLEFFYPRMVPGGVILCDGYFSWEVEPGTHMAVDEFCSKYNIQFAAIGDRRGVVIVRMG